jgi:hypothetical protein
MRRSPWAAHEPGRRERLPARLPEGTVRRYGMLIVLDEAPSDKERQQSLDNCIDLLKGVPVRLKD